MYWISHESQIHKPSSCHSFSKLISPLAPQIGYMFVWKGNKNVFNDITISLKIDSVEYCGLMFPTLYNCLFPYGFCRILGILLHSQGYLMEWQISAHENQSAIPYKAKEGKQTKIYPATIFKSGVVKSFLTIRRDTCNLINKIADTINVAS